MPEKKYMKYKLHVKWLKNRKNRRKLLKNRKNRSMLRKIGKNRNLTPCKYKHNRTRRPVTALHTDKIKKNVSCNIQIDYNVHHTCI